MENDREGKMLEAFRQLRPSMQDEIEEIIFSAFDRQMKEHKKQFRIINQRKEGE